MNPNTSLIILQSFKLSRKVVYTNYGHYLIASRLQYMKYIMVHVVNQNNRRGFEVTNEVVKFGEVLIKL